MMANSPYTLPQLWIGMAMFCNQFDRICNETGCSTIYCHHHSKGAQGMKRAMDRASGSGVFARDPDAQLDMIELEMADVTRNLLAEQGASGWRLEASLREFKPFKPVDFWFRYPIHRSGRPGSQDNFRRSFRVVSDNPPGAIRKRKNGAKNPGWKRKNPGKKPGRTRRGTLSDFAVGKSPGLPGRDFRTLR